MIGIKTLTYCHIVLLSHFVVDTGKHGIHTSFASSTIVSMKGWLWRTMAATATFASVLLHVSVRVDLAGKGDHELICSESSFLI